MMTWVRFFLAALTSGMMLAGLFEVSAAGPGKAIEADDTIKRAVVLIDVPRAGSLPPEKGTGFFVTKSGHILTAAHVLLESNENDDIVRQRQIQVKIKGESRKRNAKALYINRLVDLALLKVRVATDVPYLTLGTSHTVKHGDLLTIVGHPYDGSQWDYWNVSSAVVNSISPIEHIFLHTTVFEGQSGGPVIDENGRVVGVVAYRKEAAQQAYVVPIDDAKWFLTGLIGSGFGNRVAAATPSASSSGSRLGVGGQETKAYGTQELPGFIASVTNIEVSQNHDVTIFVEYENKLESDYYIGLSGCSTSWRKKTFLVDNVGNIYTIKTASGIGYVGCNWIRDPVFLRAGAAATFSIIFKRPRSVEKFGDMYSLSIAQHSGTITADGKWKKRHDSNVTIRDIRPEN